MPLREGLLKEVTDGDVWNEGNQKIKKPANFIKKLKDEFMTMKRRELSTVVGEFNAKNLTNWENAQSWRNNVHAHAPSKKNCKTKKIVCDIVFVNIK